MHDEVTSGRRWRANKVNPTAIALVVEEVIGNVLREGTPDEALASVTVEHGEDRTGWIIDVYASARTTPGGSEDSDAG